MSGGLVVAGLSLRRGAFALKHIDLQVSEGEILAILGPNGAGKSVTLETIAGFHRSREGRIIIAGRDATGLPPERRRVSLVPQNYGLFPHLTVAANVALPMRVASPRRGAETPQALLARFGAASLAGRLPGDLSPGERQRAALARALAANPLVFLFDEPFSALDAGTREALRDELKVFLRTAGIPVVFVTHDLAEAMGMADRLAVMQDGRILQQGNGEAVYRGPASTDVARLLGVENILAGRLMGREGAHRLVAVGDIMLRADTRIDAGNDASRTVSLCLRAEDVALAPPTAAEPDGAPGSAPRVFSGAASAAAPAPTHALRASSSPVAIGESWGGRPREQRGVPLPDTACNRLAATVRAVANSGAFVKVSLDCGFPLVARLTAREARQLGLAPGGRVIAEIAVDAIRVLD